LRAYLALKRARCFKDLSTKYSALKVIEQAEACLSELPENKTFELIESLLNLNETKANLVVSRWIQAHSNWKYINSTITLCLEKEPTAFGKVAVTWLKSTPWESGHTEVFRALTIYAPDSEYILDLWYFYVGQKVQSGGQPLSIFVGQSKKNCLLQETDLLEVGFRWVIDNPADPASPDIMANLMHYHKKLPIIEASCQRLRLHEDDVSAWKVILPLVRHSHSLSTEEQIVNWLESNVHNAKSTLVATELIRRKSSERILSVARKILSANNIEECTPLLIAVLIEFDSMFNYQKEIVDWFAQPYSEERTVTKQNELKLLLAILKFYPHDPCFFEIARRWIKANPECEKIETLLSIVDD